MTVNVVVVKSMRKTMISCSRGVAFTTELSLILANLSVCLA